MLGTSAIERVLHPILHAPWALLPPPNGMNRPEASEVIAGLALPWRLCALHSGLHGRQSCEPALTGSSMDSEERATIAG